ncbi:MAG: 50S ribosomal protein L36, partial [Kofleriaceae bacterium]|nr:50S ribosomal protein L36 [Kofleriaceae bacterium]
MKVRASVKKICSKC